MYSTKLHYIRLNWQYCIYDTNLFGTSSMVILCFIKLLCYLSRRLFQLGAMTKRQAVVSKKIRKIESAFQVYFTIADCKSSFYKPYQDFVQLKGSYKMGNLFLRLKPHRSSSSTASCSQIACSTSWALAKEGVCSVWGKPKWKGLPDANTFSVLRHSKLFTSSLCLR